MVDGKEASNAYKQVLIDVANDAFPQFSNAAKEAGENANKMTVSIESLGKSLDNIQSAYDAVKSAISEYNEAGYLSVDTFQSLMELEPQYLNMLMDEHGNLNLNTEAVQENTAAYIENMGIKAAQNLIDTVSGLSGATAQLPPTRAIQRGITQNTSKRKSAAHLPTIL